MIQTWLSGLFVGAGSVALLWLAREIWLRWSVNRALRAFRAEADERIQKELADWVAAAESRVWTPSAGDLERVVRK